MLKVVRYDAIGNRRKYLFFLDMWFKGIKWLDAYRYPVLSVTMLMMLQILWLEIWLMYLIKFFEISRERTMIWK